MTEFAFVSCKQIFSCKYHSESTSSIEAPETTYTLRALTAIRSRYIYTLQIKGIKNIYQERSGGLSNTGKECASCI